MRLRKTIRVSANTFVRIVRLRAQRIPSKHFEFPTILQNGEISNFPLPVVVLEYGQGGAAAHTRIFALCL